MVFSNHPFFKEFLAGGVVRCHVALRRLRAPLHSGRERRFALFLVVSRRRQGAKLIGLGIIVRDLKGDLDQFGAVGTADLFPGERFFDAIFFSA